MKKHGPPPCGIYRLGRRVAIEVVAAGGTGLGLMVLTVAGVAPRLAGRFDDKLQVAE